MFRAWCSLIWLYFLLLNYRMQLICHRIQDEKRASLRYFVKFQAQILHLRSGSRYEATFGLFCDLSSVGVQPLPQTLTSSQVPVSFRQHSASKSYRAGVKLPVLLRQNVAILSQQYRYRAAVALGLHLCKNDVLLVHKT